MTEGSTVPEMVNRVCDEFEVTGTQADTQEFLGVDAGRKVNPTSGLGAER